ncbi:UDP-N-acetylmuramate dehydrogenase [Clostridium thermarum]|uniref:UDP-N-acetylmuramate dehydrogenase n=1 Tax=Clostridium thermarum TaxID=1716543 RepID=UPI00111D7D14|nr:UDP-N-acetylmuramate dehydrogenase [Clostridium thermarum]
MKNYLYLLGEIKEIVGESNVLADEPMKNHTSFKVGGPADIFVIPKDYQEVQQLVKVCKDQNVPYFIIGNGSNLLVKDGGIRGVVIKLTALNKIEVQGNKIIAQSGALLSDVSTCALDHSLTGFEFACGIPGCVGGAVAMNAGAYISEMKNVIENALVIDNDANIRRLDLQELELSYRNSIILKQGFIVLEAVFNLKPGNYNDIKTLIDDLQKRRTDKQPLDYPSAGSTFKRPEGYFAGKLIEDSNLKGVSIGGAQVSNKHSGFIINTGNATAKDILSLIAYVQKTVFEKFGVELHTEVRIMGEELNN